MPIYEYQCEKCGVFEETQRITDDPLKKCPTCHHKVQKLISNTSFQLKGTGWYITDYGRGSGPKEEKSNSEKKSNGKSESSDSSKKASSTNKSSGEKSTSSATPS
jgi:putative FmdB family regulatory protein